AGIRDSLINSSFNLSIGFRPESGVMARLISSDGPDGCLSICAQARATREIPIDRLGIIRPQSLALMKKEFVCESNQRQDPRGIGSIDRARDMAFWTIVGANQRDRRSRDRLRIGRDR